MEKKTLIFTAVPFALAAIVRVTDLPAWVDVTLGCAGVACGTVALYRAVKA